MSERILLIDDEDMFREDMASLLRQQGFACRTAASGEDGLRAAQAEAPDLVLCDLVMPGAGGLEVVGRLAALYPELPVIVITAFGTLETAVEAFRSGATDYVLKPVVPEDLLGKVARCLEHRRLMGEVRYLRREVSEVRAGARLVGTSPAMEAVRRLIARVAAGDSTVLIRGESGTGKELVAREIHEVGRGPDRPCVAVNCAAVPRDLFESELFGHVRGAFTGAVRDRPGLFEVASEGTLFLDEISELPLELQPKLLRAIEQKEVLRVGESRTRPARARIVAATQRDLQAEVAAGRFREDLFFRVRVVEIVIPPLRERREDIPLLVEHFVPRLNARLKRHILGVDQAAMRALMSAPWRGNIRELENTLERAMLLTEHEYVGVGDLPAELAGRAHSAELSDDLRAALSAYEREHIRQVLATTGGNREEAARRMGIDVSTLYRRLKALDL
ncbi:MAG: sigma-54-dependent Fis family transcriptional regulator [Candidatus Eisenbacteria bacterium]|nr:sigma-54-dependent Fis family transcriptional regulator [Candidatus Eisenbacteria bacterium]